MLTLVTINYNNDDGLRRTLLSVDKQIIFNDIEHIIIDGGSVDESVDVIRSYAAKKTNVYWVSEADKGIYNGMNKGLNLASGDFVAFLNSGDVLADTHCLQKIMDNISENPEIDLIYGNLKFIDDMKRVTRKWEPGPFNSSKLLVGWMFPHPMTTIRRSILIEFCGFDERYKIAADYDLMLRIILGVPLQIRYIDNVMVFMEQGGISNSSMLQILISNVEVLSAWIRLRGIKAPFWIILTKPMIKLKQLSRWPVT